MEVTPFKGDLFEFLNSINMTKQNLMDIHENGERTYPNYMVQLMLSYHIDCILFVNELNVRGTPDFGITKRMEYEFLLNTIRKGKRFSKLAKPAKPAEAISAIMTLYGYSRKRAEDAAELLNEDQLNELIARCAVGGRSK